MKKIMMFIPIAIILIIFIYSYAIKNTDEKSEILKELSLSEGEVTRIQNVSQLIQTAPIIYNGVKDGDYEIKTNDTLIIYNFKSKRIIKQFDLSNIIMGE